MAPASSATARGQTASCRCRCGLQACRSRLPLTRWTHTTFRANVPPRSVSRACYPQRSRRRLMHSRTAALFALICVTALVMGCEVDQPLAPVTGTAPLASAAAGQKVPTDLALTASPGEIALAWRDNSPNETPFQALRSTTGQTGAFTKVATTAANGTTYIEPGLDPKQQYSYKIQAVAQKRILGVSNTACAIPQPLQPIAASNVDAQPTSTADIQITWTDNSWNEGGFRVERAASDAV